MADRGMGKGGKVSGFEFKVQRTVTGFKLQVSGLPCGMMLCIKIFDFIPQDSPCEITLCVKIFDFISQGEPPDEIYFVFHGAGREMRRWEHILPGLRVSRFLSTAFC